MFPEPRVYRRHNQFYIVGLTISVAAMLFTLANALANALGTTYSNDWGYLQKLLTLFGFALAFHLVIQSVRALVNGPQVSFDFNEACHIGTALDKALHQACRNPRIPEVS